MTTALCPDDSVHALACFTTPVDSNGMRLYKAWAESKSFDIDELVEELGNIPAQFIDAMIQALRPLQKTAGRMGMLDNVLNDKFVEAHYRFERWSSDHIPMTGGTARQLFNDFLRDNKLLKNQLEIKGQRVDLKNITVPFMHIAALHDHIVPAAASKGIIDLVGSEDKKEITLKGGHVSLVAGGNAVYRLWPQLSDWLSERCV
jgi:polyhydroxyalkanoate synthase